MRRSKKPWYRFRNVALGVVGLLAAAAAWAVFAAWTAKPGSSVDYLQKFVELTEAYQPRDPTGPNGWDAFIEAVAISEEVRAQMVADAGGPGSEPGDWPRGWGWPYDFNALRDPAADPVVIDSTLRAMDLMQQRGVPGKLAEMAATPRAVRPKQDAENAISIMLPELGRARELARWSAGRMRLAGQTGNQAELMAAFEQILAMGRVTASQHALIDRLVGVAIVALGLGELKHHLAMGAIDAKGCRELLLVIDRQLQLPPLELALQGERLYVLDTIQWTHTDDGRGSGRVIITKLAELESMSTTATISKELNRHPIVNVLGYLMPSRRETTQKTNEMFDAMIAQSRMSAVERRASDFNVDLAVENLPRGFVVLRVMIPAMGKAIIMQDQYEVELQGTRVMLALEVFRAERGGYPERLEELVPTVLGALPMDPLSGRPYGYRRLSEEEASLAGWRYLLYSVGADGVDQGGVEDSQSRFNAIKSADSKADFVINERP